MAELIEDVPEQRSLLEVILEELDAIKDKWREVGEVLKVSKSTLDELQSRLAKGAANVNDKENFKLVMKEWMEKNTSKYLWPPLLQALNNSDLDVSLLDLEGLRETYCPANESDENDDTAGTGDNESDDGSSDSQNDDDDLHRDNSHQSNCQRLTQCCCCPCRNIARCCRRMGQLFRSAFCTGRCRYLCTTINVVLLAVIITMALHAAEYPANMDELDKLLAEDVNFAKNFSEVGSRTIRILITGKTGTGKSALINGIIGKNVSKEGGLLNPTTSKVEEFKRVAQGVKMLLYDSPGLQDRTKKEKAYLLDMVKKCKEVDLVLYTIRMSDQRINVGDVEAMKKLTNAFGEKFWERAMFVLTFANEVRDPENPEDGDANQVFFEGRLQAWVKMLPETVTKELNITKKVAENIPIVPAGFYKKVDLPGRRYWFSQLWRAMFDRMKEYSKYGYGFLLEFNKDRFKRAYEVTKEDLKKAIHEQPIVKPPRLPYTSGADRVFSWYMLIFNFVLLCTLVFQF